MVVVVLHPGHLVDPLLVSPTMHRESSMPSYWGVVDKVDRYDRPVDEGHHEDEARGHCSCAAEHCHFYFWNHVWGEVVDDEHHEMVVVHPVDGGDHPLECSWGGHP